MDFVLQQKEVVCRTLFSWHLYSAPRDTHMEYSATPESGISPLRIMNIACAFYESSVLLTSVSLGIFKALAKAPGSSTSAVAGQCGLDAEKTRLLLDACVALELAKKEGDGYSNSDEASQYLVSGSPTDLSQALMYNRDVFPAWTNLEELIKTGKPVDNPEAHLGRDPQRTQAFARAMHARVLSIGRGVIPLLDFGGCSKILDIGGGTGAYASLITAANPGINCTVLDLPRIIDAAPALHAGSPDSNRITFIADDYHTASFPGDNDVILIFGVLHQEHPEAVASILSRSAAALKPGGRIYIMDMMTDGSRTQPKFSALFALNMALTTQHGWVFSSEDLEKWLRDAGFSQYKCQPLPDPLPHWLARANRKS